MHWNVPPQEASV